MARDEGILVKLVRTNWHLLGLMALILGAALVFALRPDAPANAEAASVEEEVGVELDGGDDSDPFMGQSRWAQPTKDARFQEGIKKYEHEVAYNRESPETKANLFKLANLYLQTGDYKNAAKYYVTLKADFPDYEGMRYVFKNLVICYEKQALFDLKRSTLREMMEHFSPDTPEYKYAEHELGL